MGTTQSLKHVNINFKKLIIAYIRYFHPEIKFLYIVGTTIAGENINDNEINYSFSIIDDEAITSTPIQNLNCSYCGGQADVSINFTGNLSHDRHTYTPITQLYTHTTQITNVESDPNNNNEQCRNLNDSNPNAASIDLNAGRRVSGRIKTPIIRFSSDTY